MVCTSWGSYISKTFSSWINWSDCIGTQFIVNCSFCTFLGTLPSGMVSKWNTPQKYSDQKLTWLTFQLECSFPKPFDNLWIFHTVSRPCEPWLMVRNTHALHMYISTLVLDAWISLVVLEFGFRSSNVNVRLDKWEQSKSTLERCDVFNNFCLETKTTLTYELWEIEMQVQCAIAAKLCKYSSFPSFIWHAVYKRLYV